MSSECKGCGAPIMWIATRDGKKMPLDVAKKVVYVIESDGVPRLVRGHESHFATCPKANTFRKRKENKNAKK